MLRTQQEGGHPQARETGSLHHTGALPKPWSQTFQAQLCEKSISVFETSQVMSFVIAAGVDCRYTKEESKMSAGRWFLLRVPGKNPLAGLI